MNEKDKDKLIGKLSGAVVFLSVIIIGLIVAIIALFAFRNPNAQKNDSFIGCGVVYPGHYGRTIEFPNGKNLFEQNCAGCHFPDKDMTGPAVRGARERGHEFAYENWIYDFIQREDSLVEVKDPYTLKLRETWDWLDEGSWSHKFPLNNAEIDDIMSWVN